MADFRRRRAETSRPERGRGLQFRQRWKIAVQAWVFTNKDLPEFAERLSRRIGRPVVDKTGIKGRYWFQLEWVPDHDQPGTASPALLNAIQEQLGLKLEEHIAPTEVLVIDHVEKPSDN